MNLRAAARVLTVCGVLVFAASEAAAQKPEVQISVSGSRVTIEWTPIPGAQGYHAQVGSAPGANDIIALIKLPATTRIVVDAPAGTYYLRIRAFAGNIVGPFSNEKWVTVGSSTPTPPMPSPPSSPCGLVPPTVETIVDGPMLGVSWTPVVGTSGYRVEFGLSPDRVDLFYTFGPTTTGFTEFAGIVGTFYVRVVAGNSCGTVASEPVSFTLTEYAGRGPRTPDPSPGQRLPVPSYAPAVVEQVAALYPGDLWNSCVKYGGNNMFMFRVVQALRQLDSRWGLNWKRGVQGDLSQDIVNYHYGPGPDEGSTDVYLFDIISNHCPDSGRPSPAWIDQTEETRRKGTVGVWTLRPYVQAGFSPHSQ